MGTNKLKREVNELCKKEGATVLSITPIHGHIKFHCIADNGHEFQLWTSSSPSGMCLRNIRGDIRRHIKKATA
jgi:hypothetical protein